MCLDFCTAKLPARLKSSVCGISDDMDRKKAEYLFVAPHEGDAQKTKIPVHSSMKIEQTTSRQRNMEMMGKVGIKDVTEHKRPASSEHVRLNTGDKQASGEHDPARTDVEQRDLGHAQSAQGKAGTVYDEQDASKAAEGSTWDDVQNEGPEAEADSDFDVGSFLEALVEKCLEDWYACLPKLFGMMRAPIDLTKAD